MQTLTIEQVLVTQIQPGDRILLATGASYGTTDRTSMSPFFVLKTHRCEHFISYQTTWHSQPYYARPTDSVWRVKKDT